MDNVDKIINALKPVADKIGEGAEAVFRIYTRQALAEGIVELVMSLAWLVFLAIALPKFVKWCQDNNYGFDDFWPILLSIAVSVVTLVAVCFIPEGLMHVINPQYYAIKDITCQVTHCGSN